MSTLVVELHVGGLVTLSCRARTCYVRAGGRGGTRAAAAHPAARRALACALRGHAGVYAPPIASSHAICHLHQGEGDTVTARVLADQPGKVVIEKIEGDNGRLSLNAADNCIGIAAIETLKLIGQPSCGVALTLHKVRAACRAAVVAKGAVHPAKAAVPHRADMRQRGCVGCVWLESLQAAPWGIHTHDTHRARYA